MRHSFVLLAIIPVSVLAQFGPATPISTSAHYASQIVVADLNGDGSNDLLVSAFEGAQVSWYTGTGSGTFGDRMVIDATLIGADACAAADTTVYEHRQIRPNGLGNTRQHAGRRRRLIELTPAMIGNDDAFDPVVGGHPGVLDIQDALEMKFRQTPHDRGVA